ncbi:hypothetical protein [Zobellella maritima]|uniref:hypothetical protein n=1 Tax=Zobellella maritima TaxID=2059725 RepID=UPI000E302F2C|nr:hypothetical protein [Zobellella maritima]
MYTPRKITGQPDWLDADGIKIYTISVDAEAVDTAPFQSRLAFIKSELGLDWANTAAFVIFHRGAGMNYLVLVWWGNDNELFTSVSVQEDGHWLCDPGKYSFCLYDMEVMWRERNIYIDTVDCAAPSLEKYRVSR